MSEFVGPSIEFQTEPPIKPVKSYTFPNNPEFAGQGVEKGAQDLPRATEITRESADAQISKAWEDLQTQVSPQLYDQAYRYKDRPDFDESKRHTMLELKKAMGDEAFNQFNADLAATQPVELFQTEPSPASTTTSPNRNIRQ
jgi:hypothetical protein